VRSCTHIASSSSSSGSLSESSLDFEEREDQELWALFSTLSVKQPLRLLSVTSVKLTEVLTSCGWTTISVDSSMLGQWGGRLGWGESGVVEAVRTAGEEPLKLSWCLEDTVPG